MKWILSTFAPQRTHDVYLKPLAMLTIITLCHVGVLMLFEIPTYEQLMQHALIMILTIAPFVVLAYALITYLDELQGVLRNEAKTDVLTGLPNRRAFLEAIQNAIDDGEDGFLLIIDADFFKRINDTYGHLFGDKCLIKISDRVQSITQTGDLFGRIGGEEFGVFLKNRTMADLQIITTKLCFPIMIDIDKTNLQKRLRITVSAGVTEVFPNDTISKVMQRADEALFVAKDNGRERAVFWRRNPPEKAAS